MQVYPDAAAKSRITGQIVYLGDNLWTYFGGDELECETGKGRWPVKGVSSTRAVIWATGELGEYLMCVCGASVVAAAFWSTKGHRHFSFALCV